MKFNILFVLTATSSVLAAYNNEIKGNSTDINSYFTYDDGMKYFENLACSTDNNCPERANCIGNKCVTTFFCKDGDKSTCSLSKNKPYSECEKNEDCMTGECITSSDNKKYCFGQVTEYSTGLFTYDQAKTYFENMDMDCKKLDCPNHSYCDEQNKCLGEIYCKKDKSICSFLYSREEELRNEYHISKTRNYGGLKDDGEDCIYNGECQNKCLRKDFLGRGRCGEASDSDNLSGIGFVFAIITLVFFEFCICICLFTLLSYKYIVNSSRKKKGLDEKKIESIKSLTKSAIIFLLLIVILGGFIGIDSCLNRKSYIVSYVHFYLIITLIFILFSIGICKCVIYFSHPRDKNELPPKKYTIISKYLKIASIIIGIIFILLVFFAILDALLDKGRNLNRDFPIC